MHDCPGPTVPAPEFPVPSLAVGGELDGVVRVARLAEAWKGGEGSWGEAETFLGPEGVGCELFFWGEVFWFVRVWV